MNGNENLICRIFDKKKSWVLYVKVFKCTFRSKDLTVLLVLTLMFLSQGLFLHFLHIQIAPLWSLQLFKNLLFFFIQCLNSLYKICLFSIIFWPVIFPNHFSFCMQVHPYFKIIIEESELCVCVFLQILKYYSFNSTQQNIERPTPVSLSYLLGHQHTLPTVLQGVGSFGTFCFSDTGRHLGNVVPSLLFFEIAFAIEFLSFAYLYMFNVSIITKEIAYWDFVWGGIKSIDEFAENWHAF